MTNMQQRAKNASFINVESAASTSFLSLSLISPTEPAFVAPVGGDPVQVGIRKLESLGYLWGVVCVICLAALVELQIVTDKHRRTETRRRHIQRDQSSRGKIAFQNVDP